MESRCRKEEAQKWVWGTGESNKRLVKRKEEMKAKLTRTRIPNGSEMMGFRSCFLFLGTREQNKRKHVVEIGEIADFRADFHRFVSFQIRKEELKIRWAKTNKTKKNVLQLKWNANRQDKLLLMPQRYLDVTNCWMVKLWKITLFGRRRRRSSCRFFFVPHFTHALLVRWLAFLGRLGSRSGRSLNKGENPKSETKQKMG